MMICQAAQVRKMKPFFCLSASTALPRFVQPTWSEGIPAMAPWTALIGCRADHNTMVSYTANQSVLWPAVTFYTLGESE